MDVDRLPVAEFAFPGPLRDALVAAILDGSKTSTASTVEAYAVDGEPLPRVGELAALVDSAGRRVAVIETTEVRRVRLADVDLQHAVDEGEGYQSVEQWREGHVRFWHSRENRAEMRDPSYTVDDDTELVLERFVVVERL
ncbi:ASCH domain-containing protein [Solicola sp. PLA-1-18]|uniref:ASCH domain-containing protein n=1 Tax=Solicola sp. PLA-1-18 TaxID=3380532 RepID=UPI003B78DE1F